jgi:hypothetical protein
MGVFVAGTSKKEVSVSFLCFIFIFVMSLTYLVAPWSRLQNKHG